MNLNNIKDKNHQHDINKTGQNIEKLDANIYLEQTIALSKKHQEEEINRRIS